MTTYTLYGPWPAGSAGAVSVLSDAGITTSDLITTHVHKGKLYWTVIHV